MQESIDKAESTIISTTTRSYSSITLIKYLPNDKYVKRARKKSSCTSVIRKRQYTVTSCTSSQRIIPQIKLFSASIGDRNSLNYSTLYVPHFHFPLKPNCKTPSSPEPLTVQIALHENLNNVAVVAGKRLNKFMLHIYLNDRGVWSLGQEIPTLALPKRCKAVDGQCLYFIGGDLPGSPHETKKSKDIFIYNIRTEELRKGPSLPFVRSNSGIAVWDHVIYVAGGVNRYNNSLSNVLAYNTLRNAWSTLPSTKYSHKSPGMFIVDGVIYVIGGFTVRCEVYPLQKRFWRELPSLPVCFRDVAMTATCFENVIVAFRNFRPNKVAVLDYHMDDWTVVWTSGVPPVDIEDSFAYRGAVYVLTTAGKIFKLYLKELVWQESVCCPKTLSKIYHITWVSLNNIR